MAEYSFEFFNDDFEEQIIEALAEIHRQEDEIEMLITPLYISWFGEEPEL
jgi:hypothetical protein